MAFVAYRTADPAGWEILPGHQQRDWMDMSYQRSAYRCLPLSMANQSGWVMTCPATVRVRWNGGFTLDAVEIERWQTNEHIPSELPDYAYPASHFGSGVITWTPPFVFRTPIGWNMLARGPANYPRDGTCALEGLVETDWSQAPFTVNYKLTSPDAWVTFAKGEPLCMIVPQRRGDLEGFDPQIAPIKDDPELAHGFAEWAASRDKSNAAISPDQDVKIRWQLDYMKSVGDMRRHLKPFEDLRGH